ncbi:hypothetical protein SUGI_0062560 [Cryptomeria japonica]|uniref:uncharacterized protein LOC131073478 n=1 Tax=Cryptomeria japonica TaxID=3369 RepID=UPI002408C780|nr:uncharacterized protein LOC131073478 [Cryptomeria japonica]GLJ07240.1 hypothetical protein SUGI_0062560 [Cryptomeria japonica]
MCLQLWLPTTEGVASRSSEESLHTKYEIAMKTTSFEHFCEEVRRTIDGTLSQSPSHIKNPLRQFLLPDEEHINTHVLQQYINKPELQTLLTQYFSNTQNAFELCARLLKSTHHARMSYRAIRDINFRLQSTNFDFQEEECRRIRGEFKLFVEQENPFGQAAQFDEICNSLEELNQLPELRPENKPKFFWVAEKQSAQLDGAARGIYVLKNHLKTTRVLVAGLYDVVENTKTIMGVCLAREDEVYPLQQVGKLLERNDSGFGQRFDEIEEQGCLCLRNINRARMLLLQIHH